MKIKSILAAVLTLLYINLNAQNNDGLQSISKQKLETLLKEHKPLHFVTTNGSKGAEVKFYIDNDKHPSQAVAPSAGNSTAVVNFHLVKDINAQTDANPVNPGLYINNNGPYAVLNNIMYFSANDGKNGAELWRSDGTAAGTFMVKDIEPGTNGSYPSEITVAGNKIIFSTQNKITFTYALWVSDGTAAGTSLLKDNVGQGQGVNSCYNLTNVSGTVYFFINYSAQLWKTNGTVAGTTMVKDFAFDGQAPFLPFVANGLFYFTIFTNENGRELWRSDGTNAGTFMLKDISPSFDFFAGPEQLTVFNSKLYFTANDGTGRKLWLTDGTSSGTVLAGGQNNVLFMDDDIIMDLFNRPFIVTGSNFYTAASTGTTGMELYKYNIAAGFSLVKDITPGMPGGQFFYYEKLGNAVAFTYYDSVNRQNQLWRSDGTTANTVLIKSYGDSIYIANLYAGNKLLYFTSNAINGYELWKTNGTPAGTGLVKDIYAGPTSANPASLTLYKDKMFFKAASKNAGTELWQTDGTEAGTVMLPEINTVATNYSAPDYSFNYNYNDNTTPGAAIDKIVYFSATTPETGYELYRSNGIAAGTTLASDLIPGENSSAPRNFLTKNHAVYFTAYSNDRNSINKVDSTGNVTMIISTDLFLRSYDVDDNGSVFYSVSNSLTNKNELWHVAANGSGNVMLTDKLADNNNYRFIVKVVNNKAYFTAADENGTELWVSNGTIAGTRMVKDIFSGTNSANPYSLYAYNNNIFFGADDGSGAALWRSNGTDAVKVKNIAPYGLNSYNTDYNDFFCVVNNVLYLTASTADKGSELWKTNGTTAGTVLVKDISPGTESSNLSFLTNVNGTLFFAFYNYQLWKSDGTPNGTVIVKNNIYTTDYYLFSERCVADGKLFFNTAHLLWVSDGTDAGTHQVADNGLNGVSSVKNLVAAGNIVFFNGTTDKYNAELYAGDATKITNLVSAVKQVQPQSFSAVVLQNPIASQLNVQVQSSTVQSLIITVSNTNGNIIAQKTVDVIKGSNQFSLDASSWHTGIHAVKISNTKGEMVSLKVLK